MQVVICGGGIAGSFLANSFAVKTSELSSNVKSVILIEPKRYFEAPNGVIGAVHHPDYLSEFSCISKSANLAWDRRIQHISARVVRVDHSSKEIELDTGNTIKYDILCLAMGSRTVPDGIWRPQETTVTLDERLAEIDKYRKRISSSKTVLVAGGGIIGVEMLCELCARFRDVRFHFAIADEDVLVNFPRKVRRTAMRHLRKQPNVQVHLKCGKLGEPSADGIYRFGDWEIRPDLVLKCFPYGLNTSFLPSEWLDDRKQVKVNACLAVEGTDNTVFAVGDIASVSPKEKSAKTALDHARIGLVNISLVCTGSERKMHNFTRPRIGLVIKLGPAQSLLYLYPYLGLYGTTASGSYLADLIRKVLLARVLHESTTGGSSAGILKDTKEDGKDYASIVH